MKASLWQLAMGSPGWRFYPSGDHQIAPDGTPIFVNGRILTAPAALDVLGAGMTMVQVSAQLRVFDFHQS